MFEHTSSKCVYVTKFHRHIKKLGTCNV